MDFANLVYKPKWQWLNLGPADQPTFSMCDSSKCMIWSFSSHVIACFLIASLGFPLAVFP